MKLKNSHWIGIIIGALMAILSLFFIGTTSFLFIFGFGILLGAVPFVFSVILENAKNVEKEAMFIEFSRNLVESVRTGTPISKSIANMKGKDFGVLNVHISKLANQIRIGISLTTALKTFAKDVNNKTVSRAVSLIGQAEKAGGDIGQILESVAGAVTTSDKLKKERKAAVSTLVVQGYIIFFVFIVIILVMQFKIIPMVSGISGTEGLDAVGFGGGGGGDIDESEIADAFFYLLLTQGFFNGLAIGKLSEGSVKAGIKHSFALVAMSFLVSVTVNMILG